MVTYIDPADPSVASAETTVRELHGHSDKITAVRTTVTGVVSSDLERQVDVFELRSASEGVVFTLFQMHGLGSGQSWTEHRLMKGHVGSSHLRDGLAELMANQTLLSAPSFGKGPKSQ